jgi:alkanesulfonate monooxygenase SsuD/methylene tetrahydromethanopterin reductase-like flavin-dependent oxidoreductase (luciferase family)
VDRILASPQGAQIDHMMKHTAVGTPDEVGRQLRDFATFADTDELMVCHQSPTIAGRLRSLELTAEAMDCLPKPAILS